MLNQNTGRRVWHLFFWLARPRNSKFPILAPGAFCGAPLDPGCACAPRARLSRPLPTSGGLRATTALFMLGRGVVSRRGPKLLARTELQTCAFPPAFSVRRCPAPCARSRCSAASSGVSRNGRRFVCPMEAPTRGGGSQFGVYPYLTITSTRCSQAR
jgi:hypothetical protein